MPLLNSLNASTKPSVQPPAGSTLPKTPVVKSYSADASASMSSSSETDISPLAQLLSDAAARAAARDANASRKELAELASAALNTFLGPGYRNLKAIHDAAVPHSDDPQRLAQARQATDFVNGRADNPFKHMSRDQLALITYDESGAFTLNERRAAWTERSQQHSAWSKAITEQMMDEYNRYGTTLAKSYETVLDYYKSLPAIEEARLPASYEFDLHRMITHANTINPTELESPFELLPLGLNDDEPT